MFTSSLLLSVATFSLLACAVLYMAGGIFRQKQLLLVGTFTALGSLVLLTAGILLRWKESYDLGYGHAPLSNLYESLVFGAWAIILIYLVLELRIGKRALGIVPSLISFLAMAYASFSTSVDSRIQPLLPALKSNWLIAHVVACFIGYAAFAVSAGISILYLSRGAGNTSANPGNPDSFLPAQSILDELNHQMVLFGFFWLSIGIITGSVWANSAWGTYWSWDPKETWSLITWLVYAGVLHARAMRGWRGQRVAWISMLGFGCVLFTYFGVNFLLKGLHSYATN